MRKLLLVLGLAGAALLVTLAPHQARAQAALAQQLGQAAADTEDKIPLFGFLSAGTTNGFSRANPLFVLSLSANVGYRIPVINTQMIMNVSGSVELTKSDATSSFRNWQWADTLLFFQRPVYTIPVIDVTILYRMQFLFPTSQQSKFETRLLTWENRVSLIKSFDFGLTFLYAFGFRKPFHESNTPQVRPGVGTEPFVSPAGFSGDLFERAGNFVNVGALNEAYTFRNIAAIIYNIDQFSFFLFFFAENGYTYMPNTSFTDAESGITVSTPDVSRGKRNVWGTSLSVFYNVTPSLSLVLGISTGAPMLKPNAKDYYNPFWVVNANNFTTGSFSIQYGF
jgi:hypothetical protein